MKTMNFSPAERVIFALEDGDVLVTEGSGSIETVGTSAVWRQDLPGVVCFQNTLLRLRPRTGITTGPYLAWWARHARVSGQIAAISSGANIKHLGSDGLKRLTLEVPSPEDQQRIADFLDDRVARIDQIIAARQRQAASVGSLLQSIPDRLLAERKDPWTRLGLLVRGIEQGWSPQCEAVPAQEAEWGVLKVGAVQPGWFDAMENKRLPDAEQPMPEYEIKAGDLLVSRANTPERVGFFAVVPEHVRARLILCDKIMRIEVDPSLEPAFVALVGQSRKSRDHFTLAGTGTSGSMVNIRGDDVRNLRLPLIPRQAQRQAVATWSRESARLRKHVQSLETAMNLLAEYKQSLITAAVTGELDVTTAGSGIPG